MCKFVFIVRHKYAEYQTLWLTNIRGRQVPVYEEKEMKINK